MKKIKAELNITVIRKDNNNINNNTNDKTKCGNRKEKYNPLVIKYKKVT